MKRHGHLLEQVVAFENLLRAFRQAYRGCSQSTEAQKFCFHLEAELLCLQQEIRQGEYLPGKYWHFKVFDPKERLISVAPFRDRVAHHALVNVLEPIYERRFIYDSYATRKNKGTHQAILRVQKMLRQHEWYLRTDIKKHFENIDHDVLLSILNRQVKDQSLLRLAEVMVRSVPWKKGLPIGNLTSQFFANVYLDPLDHFIKEQLRVRCYVRYMDDSVFLSNDKEMLKKTLQAVQEFIEQKLKLQLKEKAVYLNYRANGISFVGARIFPQHLRLKAPSLRRSIRRWQTRLQEYEAGLLEETALMATATSTMGHWRFFDAYQLRQSLGQAGVFGQ